MYLLIKFKIFITKPIKDKRKFLKNTYFIYSKINYIYKIYQLKK